MGTENNQKIMVKLLLGKNLFLAESVILTLQISIVHFDMTHMHIAIFAKCA